MRSLDDLWIPRFVLRTVCGTSRSAFSFRRLGSWDSESIIVQSQMKVIAAAFALCAFVIAIISGLAADNPGSQVILQAGITLLVCHLIGSCAAACFAHLVQEHTELYINQRAIPSIDMSSQDTQYMVDDQNNQGAESLGSTAQGNQKNSQKSSTRG